MKEEPTLSSPHDHKEVTSILANERTYAAWIRTGLTSLATGLVALRFLTGYIPHMNVRVMSFLLILSSVFCFILAAWRYWHVDVRLTTANIFGTPVPFLLFGSFVLVVVAILALIGVWFT